jgi:alpha-L-fucosidase 2
MRHLAFVTLMAAALLPLEAAEFKDVEYGRAGDLSLRMDAHVPPGKGPHPAAILVHGGGWIRGDRAWNVQPLFTPLADAGIAWFSISYRLATDIVNLGAAVQDVRQAIHYVHDNSARYHVDPKRIVLIGESAGAHLSSLAALADPASIAAVVSLYSPNDLELLARTSPAVPAQIRAAVEGSGFAALLLGHLRSLSPIHHVSRNAPPFLLIHGTADTVVPFEQSVRMQEKLLAAGAQCDLVPIRGGGHGIRYWDRSPSQLVWRRELVSWLRTKLRMS